MIVIITTPFEIGYDKWIRL